MSDLVHCPKCKSEQFTAQKPGFSGGKAFTGAVLTGGVGALAGFHGSDKIDLYCLSCGHKWNPAEQTRQVKQKAQQAQTERLHQASKKDKIWKRQFYQAYEGGDVDEADSIIRPHLRKLVDRRGLDGAYKELKKLDRISSAVKLLFLVTFIAVIIWLVS